MCRRPRLPQVDGHPSAAALVDWLEEQHQWTPMPWKAPSFPLHNLGLRRLQQDKKVRSNSSCLANWYSYSQSCLNLAQDANFCIGFQQLERLKITSSLVRLHGAMSPGKEKSVKWGSVDDWAPCSNKSIWRVDPQRKKQSWGSERQKRHHMCPWIQPRWKQLLFILVLSLLA